MAGGAGPRLVAPPGATDCHMHIIGPEADFPFSPGHAGKFPVWTIAQYDEVAARLGLDRCVVTMTPFYGTDNSGALAAMRALGAERARGVAVVDPSTGEEELDRLSAAGFCAANFFMMQGGELNWSVIAPTAARLAERGWHTQIQLDGCELLDRYDALADLPGTLAIDHVGKFQRPTGIDDPAFARLLSLVESGRTYVKLSAPYESAWSDPPYLEHSGGLAMELIRRAPDRMLWGSNWPHLGTPDVADWPDDAMLLDTLLAWTDDEAARRQILVDNPARLFGFDA